MLLYITYVQALSSDPCLKAEIEYDLKVFEKQTAATAASARDNDTHHAPATSRTVVRFSEQATTNATTTNKAATRKSSTTSRYTSSSDGDDDMVSAEKGSHAGDKIKTSSVLQPSLRKTRSGGRSASKQSSSRYDTTSSKLSFLYIYSL